ncbi:MULTISPECIES: symmetrical bis(5'-nucleosyl)-tetraphosphatase [Moraxella]|uniref:bis(5'-nucleosyl)-tetraphosphatase (symmetrical) n=1 Tax=Moraxella lacunata TaxID=477 RepID=A0A1B8PZH4_MORLA|nr:MULTISPECIES: symmetrical bis(5'-nucleosyl)-tetraphosphatase [Moraxella]MBE9578276.1 symmetrical bis(5'-nucleosyl)-tetraphosphatase [Moraxella sp. K1664]MBE9587362.1 symmetrical bis(5'-nucleosyl)-tetraphosphatase [Moraxella sp. K1630]MBE9590305.1 symmetrical bis(5'-nucleosyl)-tetraphosphatase [Moraxella sp. K127]MBE9595898.1 symmetrical bis(5'-nucleosyl)-tetraphosphatase [Moraxella sp. K2450]MDH9219457.1 symmetrical bis(5'-nucleosyl)-tetraphosphatase [Moraxella lacunata]
MTKNLQKTYRHEYVIGDLQGCFNAFNRLLVALDFDETQDKIWLCGDIVARGENSLDTLRQVKRLSDIGALTTVLGNHDITLIATWRGVLPIKPKDNTAPIFVAPDCDELLDWLRHQSFLVYPNDTTVLTHAGIPPHWKVKDAKGYANELAQAFGGDLDELDKLLPNLYSKATEPWSDELIGHTRLRLIANYLTRMRLCDKHGTLEFSFKESLGDTMPLGYRPWFDWEVARKRKILFGHWAALEAKIATQHVRALDGGCVWGGKLVAYRLADEHIITVSGFDA